MSKSDNLNFKHSVSVTVEVAYEPITIDLTNEEWERVSQGEYLMKKVDAGYDGEIFPHTFFFNDPDNGHQLYICYERYDEGLIEIIDGFMGSLKDAHIHFNES